MVETPEESAKKWLDDMDPAILAQESSRSDDLRRIGEALTANSEEALTAAIAAARAQGRSWADIALILGTSRQAAQQDRN